VRPRWILACLLGCGWQFAGAACDGRLELQILGSGGPESDDGRASSGYLLRLDGVGRVLVDFGGGAGLTFEHAGGRIEELDAILLTHLHVDHSADLPALVKAAYFTGRTRQLPVYGPAGNRYLPAVDAWLRELFSAPGGAWPYLADNLVDTPGNDLKLVPRVVSPADDQRFEDRVGPFDIAAVPVVHGPIPALAWRVEAGGCSVTFSGDTSNARHSLEGLAMDSDLLVAHHAVPEDAGPVALTLHMPPSEIGRVAGAAGVRAVVLSHRMRRTFGREAESEELIRRSYTGPLYWAEDRRSYPIGSSHERQ